MWASTIAHNDTLSVGRVKDFASHQIEHELSALYDCAHGAGLAVVFPGWLRFMLQKPDKVMRLAQFAVRVWGCQMDFEHPEKTAQAGIDAYVAWLKEIGMPVTFARTGRARGGHPLPRRQGQAPQPGRHGGQVLRPEHRGHREDLPPVPVSACAHTNARPAAFAERASRFFRTSW